MSSPSFPLEIMTREGIVFKDQVASLTSYNSRGKFDILPHHANYICIIEKKLIIRDIEGQEKEFSLFAGLLQFINNSGKIFLGFNK